MKDRTLERPAPAVNPVLPALLLILFAAGQCSPRIPSEPRPGIALAPDAGRVAIIAKNPAEDCRVVRGFNGAPVDGSVRSWTYIGWVTEYPGSSRDFIDPLTGVNYWYNGNDGVHITLRDGKGFDAVVLRGGAKTRMYAGSPSIEEPAGVPPLHAFAGRGPCEIVRFSRRQNTDRASFFGAAEGRIADVGFYRVEEGAAVPAGAEPYSLAPDHLNISIPREVFAPGDVYHALNERYGEIDWIAHSLVPDKGSSEAKKVRAGESLHGITDAFDAERGLAAVAFDLAVSGPKGEFTLTAVVQDPLDSRLDLAWVPLRCVGEGRYTFCLDIPDQVLLEG